MKKIFYLCFVFCFCGCSVYSPLKFKGYKPQIWQIENRTDEPLLGSRFRNILENELSLYVDEYPENLTPEILGIKVIIRRYSSIPSIQIESQKYMNLTISARVVLYNSCEKVILRKVFSSVWQFFQGENIPETESLEEEAQENILRKLAIQIIHNIIRTLEVREKSRGISDEKKPSDCNNKKYRTF